MEKAGADSLRVGERLAVGMAAAVAERARLGTNVLIAPLYRPAEQAGLDSPPRPAAAIVRLSRFPVGDE
jgi:hypothetical protein